MTIVEGEFQQVDEFEAGDEFYLSATNGKTSIWGGMTAHNPNPVTYLITEILKDDGHEHRVLMKSPRNEEEPFVWSIRRNHPYTVMAKRAYKAYDPEQIGDRDDDL